MAGAAAATFLTSPQGVGLMTTAMKIWIAIIIIFVVFLIVIIIIAVSARAAKRNASSYISPTVATRLRNDPARMNLPPMTGWQNTNVW
jgi:low affinity Fe/Cu permease